MKRLLKSLVAASALSAWIALPSCAPKIDWDTYLQQEVTGVRQRIEPPGSHLVRPPSVSHQNWGASASWGFESSYSADAYNAWVTGRLRPDFEVSSAASSPLRFSKYTHGDEETLSVDVASSSGPLHVTVKIEIYPD